MNKHYLIIVTLIILHFNASSQNNATSHKEKTTRVVYEQLTDAFGDGRKPPELKFIPYKNIKDSVIAAFIPGDIPAIEIEEIAYDVCMSFGKDSLNALACVLGHELSHFYLKHDWCSNFSKRLSHISIAADLYKMDKEEQLKKESEADYNGFYYGSIAGYKSFDIAPALLKKLYATYKLNPNLKGYPTLEKRIEAATQSKSLVLRRLPVFDAGICLYEIGEYEIAFECFSNLLTDFTSRENYNNAAVCKLQLALKLFEPYEMPFFFPFEIDYESRIFSSNTRYGTLDRKEERKKLLGDAKKLLEECMRKDPAYSKAKTNMAICYILLGNIDMASGILYEFDAKVSSGKSILSSIIAAKKGDLNRALRELDSINVTEKSQLVNYNKRVFELALQLNLKIGDDELGYQIRKAGKLVSSNSNENMVAQDKISCFDTSSKSVATLSDSIQLPSAKLYSFRSDKNYDRVIKVKLNDNSHDFYIYHTTDLNKCFSDLTSKLLYIDKREDLFSNITHRHLGNYIVVKR